MCFGALLIALQPFSGFLAQFTTVGFPNSIPRTSVIFPTLEHVFYGGKSTGKCHLLPKTVCGKNYFGNLIKVPSSCLRDPFQNLSMITDVT